MFDILFGAIAAIALGVFLGIALISLWAFFYYLYVTIFG